MRSLRRFGILVLTIVLASAWGCASTATREGTGEWVDDSVVTTKVKAAIFNDSTLKVNEINACDLDRLVDVRPRRDEAAPGSRA